MEIADAETESCRGLEASARGVHPDRRGCVGIVGCEDQSAPVLSSVIRGVGRTGNDVVPSGCRDVGSV